MLEINELSFDYLDHPILKNLSLCIGQGEVIAIVGPSGSGKTTLFKLVAGFEKPKKGTLKAPDLSYMMQEDLLLPWKTALQNILFAYEVAQVSPSIQEAKELLYQVGLKGFEDHYPKALSTGMRQRVSLARALVFKRPLLLLDEPFGSIDPFRKRSLYELLLKLRASYGFTVVLITHDVDDAFTFAQKVYYLKQGELLLCKEKQCIGEML